MNGAVRDCQVLILAGGIGTRLRPLSIYTPKALSPVCNLSLLNRMLTELQSAGIGQATITLPPMGDEIASRAKAAAPRGFDLLVELQIGAFAGTVPAVRRLLNHKDSPVLVIYGDSLLSVDFAALLEFHSGLKMNGAGATILSHRPLDLRLEEAAGRTLYGVMAIDPCHRVIKFVEKPEIAEIVPGFDTANAAVFVCERALFEDNRFSEARDFSYEVFQPAVSENLVPIYACDIGNGFRYDIGSIRRFYAANMDLLSGRLPGRIPGKQSLPGVWVGNGNTSNGRLEPPVLLGDSLRISAEVRIGPDTIIGDGCIIGAGATIRRSIVMEGCKIGVGAVIDSCILGPHCVIEDNQRLPQHTVIGAYGLLGSASWHL
jgi:mannose-1-phosphate guanylyltransferase/phosphomannomutase